MKKLLLILWIVLLTLNQAYSQKQNNQWLLQYSKTKSEEYQQKKAKADSFALANKIPIRQELEDGTIIEIQYIDELGQPQFYMTDNAGAAVTGRATSLYSGGGLGLNVTGNGYSKVGEWDGGKVLNTHDEFGTRITLGDGYSTTSDHATHVAGTIIAAGIDADAKGMAYEANLETYYWDNDESEVAVAGAAGMELSNHSYGYVRGWYWDGSQWLWNGNTSISSVEDYLFGFYDSNAQQWDQIAYNAPNYLIVKSAGNDRGDGPGATPATAEKDGGDDGYDCIGTRGICKNLLTVGAVNEVLNYTGPSDVTMSSFSSWGPADDGRIKPDIVNKGVDLYSTSDAGNTSYVLKSGTSMSSPATTGTLVLLRQHYQNTHGGSIMKASTLKALILNTADEAGPHTGPDYMFGWGLLNAERAATLISEDASTQNVIDEQTLTNGGTYTRNITVGADPVKVTIVWTDPPGTPVSAQLDPSDPMLVNDLDLRLTGPTGTHYPWKLDRDNPSAAATNSGENNVDNVETVYIANPTPGTYSIIVNHDGTLASSQDFSIVIQGLDEYSAIPSSCASLISPTNGATGLELTTVIEWSEVSDATSYDVYFGTDAAATNILNGVNQGGTKLQQCLSPNTTYYLKIQPRNNQGARTTCTTIWSFTTGSVSTAALPYSENFDGLTEPNIPTNWEHDSGNDFDWESEAGTTPSGDTGPLDDVTGGGKYLFTEASTPNYPAKTAVIYTPYFDLSSISNPQLDFYYHMYGVNGNMGTLTVDIFDNGEWHTIFTKTGNQNVAVDNNWNQATIDLTPYDNCGYQRIRIKGVTNGWDSDMAFDEISITSVAGMSYVSSTTTQSNTSDVLQGATDREIIGIEVVTADSNSPIDVTSMSFDTNGSTDAANDIANAKVYYTGTGSTFAVTGQFGTTIVGPDGDFTVNGTQTLSEGTNYFWLAYDIEATATATNEVDAECTSITVDGSAETPTVQAPAGSRTIAADPCISGVSVFPWTEDFENGGSIPDCWSQEYVSSNLDWIYQSGGQSGNPAAAHGGSYNAFFYEGSTNGKTTKLITPKLDLSSLSNPEISFWHAQAAWLGDQDELRVYYKTSAGGSWTQIAEYTGDISSWTQETLTLPNPSNDYYVAFEGKQLYGYGVVLDDISITGTVSEHTVSGVLSYFGSGTPLSGETVNLMDGASTVGTDVTDGTGNYSFSNVPDGSYTLETSIGAAWGGVTGDDITLFKQHIANISLLTGLPLSAGDADNGGSVNVIDLVYIMQRFFDDILVLPNGDWLLSSGNLTVSGSDLVHNMDAICYGDANYSWTSGGKSMENINIQQDDLIVVEEGDNFTLPVSIQNDIDDLASVTLIFDYNTDLFELHEVSSEINASDWEWRIKNGTVKILYSTLNAENIQAGDVLFTLNGSAAHIPQETLLTANISGEFADYGHSFVSGVILSMPAMANTAPTAVISTEEDIEIYPNPANYMVNIINAAGADITIFNVYGSTVRSIKADATTETIDLSALSGGTYFIKIHKNNQIFIRKLTIVK